MSVERKDQGDRLTRLVCEVRDHQPPPVPFDDVERRLLVEYERAVGSGALGKRRGLGRASRSVSWLAAAAAVVVGVGVARSFVGDASEVTTSTTRPSAVAPPPATDMDGSKLALGASVQATADAALRVEHAGEASWELGRNSRARLLERRPALTIELERGMLNASVVPRGVRESFVVRALDTEVVVHGTRFRVAIEDQRVSVAVTEGEVEVRPISRAESMLLTAGMSGDFVAGVLQPSAGGAAAPSPMGNEASPNDSALSQPRAISDARRSAQPRGTPGTRTSRPQPVGPETPAEDSAHPSSAQADPAVAPTAPSADAAVARVKEHIESCFRRHTPGRGAVSIQAASRLVLEVQPNGLILEVNLEPPLAPHVEHCVASELANVNLGATDAGFRIEREIRVSR